MDRVLGRFLAVLVLVWAVNLPAQTVVELGGVSNDGGAFVNFGIADSSNNEKVAMPLTLSGPAAISKVVVQLTKVGNPADNVVIEVRQGSPDGALLASASISGSSISASGSRHELAVPAFVVPSGSISVVYSRSGASNPSNFFKAVRGVSGSNYGEVSSGGYMYLKTGFGWAGSDLANAAIVSLWGTTVSMGQAAVLPGASVSFGDITVGQTVQQQFRIKNTGTAALTVTGVSSNNTAFTLSPAIPPNVGVNVGDSAAVTVTFAPASVGVVSGNVTITHNGVNSPAVVGVSGNGVTSGGSSGGSTPPPPPVSVPVPGITLLPTSLVMDSVNVGGPGSHKTFEIRNDSSLTLNISSVTVSGTNSGEFLVNLGASAVEVGGKRIAVVSFFPATAGAKSAVVNIFHNAPGGVSTVPISGVAGPFVPGTSGSAISVAPQSINFDTVGVGSSRTLNLTVSNPGSAVLVVSGIVLAGADPSHFSLSRTNLAVEPGQERFINVTFTPASVGPKTATLVLANNTANPAITVSLVGTTPVFFATPRVSISADRREGPAPLVVHFSNVNSGGQANYWEWQPGDRSGIGLTTIIKHGGEGGDTLTYVYSQPGVYRPKLALFGPGGGDAQYMADSILVLAPQPPRAVLRLDSDSLRFGSISVGGGIVSSFRVFNTGAAELHGRVTLDGDNSFNVTSGDSIHIPVGSEGRAISIRFVPLSAGAKNGRLIVSYNSDSSEEIILSGEGASAAVDLTTVAPGPRLVASVTQADLGDIFVDRDTSYVMIPVRNSGDAVLTGRWFLDDDGGSFSVTPDSTSLSPGLSDTVTVDFTPQIEGEKTARLYFFHNAAVQPLVISLSGTGKMFVVSAGLVDFDGSGMVDFGDFFMFAEHFGQSLSSAEIRIFDLNGDGRVDNDDFFIFGDFFGRRVEQE